MVGMKQFKHSSFGFILIFQENVCQGEQAQGLRFLCLIVLSPVKTVLQQWLDILYTSLVVALLRRLNILNTG